CDSSRLTRKYFRRRPRAASASSGALVLLMFDLCLMLRPRAVPLLSRSAASAGIVTLRQIFVCRCQVGGAGVAGLRMSNSRTLRKDFGRSSFDLRRSPAVLLTELSILVRLCPASPCRF